MSIEKMEKEIYKMIAKNGLKDFTIAMHNALAHGTSLSQYGCDLYNNDLNDYLLGTLFDNLEVILKIAQRFERMKK